MKSSKEDFVNGYVTVSGKSSKEDFVNGHITGNGKSSKENFSNYYNKKYKKVDRNPEEEAGVQKGSDGNQSHQDRRSVRTNPASTYLGYVPAGGLEDPGHLAGMDGRTDPASSYLEYTPTGGLEDYFKQRKEWDKKNLMDQVGFEYGGDFYRYDEMGQQPDFDAMVDKGRKDDNVFQQNSMYGPLDYLDANHRKVLKGAQNNFTYMNDMEKELYYYLNGKYGAGTASDYIKSINTKLNSRSEENVTEKTTAAGKNHPLASAAMNTAVSVVGSGAYPVMLVRQLYRDSTGDYSEIDPNDPLFGSAMMRDGLKSGIKENETLKNLIPNEKKRSFALDTGLSMSESIARYPFGNIGLAFAAGDAGLSGTRDALERGGDTGQAIALGMTNAAAEAFFEKFSLEGLQGLKAGSAKTVKDFLKNVAKQAFTEGSEEVFTEISNTISDAAIMGELSNYNREMDAYMAQGMPEAEAKINAFKSFLANVGLAGLGGAISGGVMGAGKMGLDAGIDYAGTAAEGRDINPDYREFAQSIDTNEENYNSYQDFQNARNLQEAAEGYAKRQQQGEYIGNHEKGKYQRNLNAFVQDVAEHEGRHTRSKWRSGDAGETEEVSDFRHDFKMGEENGKPSEQSSSEPAFPAHPEQDSLEPVPPAEMQQDDRTDREALGLWAEVYGENGRKAFQESYDYEGHENVESYYRAFAKYYNAGRYNMEPSMASRSAMASMLTQEQAEAAYKAGAQDRNMESRYDSMARGEVKKGGLAYAAETATNEQKQVADAFGKKTGLKFHLVDDVGSGVTASYAPGEIRISVNSKNFNASLSHELTHFIQDYAPDLYQLHQDTVIKALTESKGVDLESLTDSYGRSYEKQGQTLSRAQIMDEIAADATEGFLNDADYINKTIRESRTLGERILDFLDDVIEALKSMMQKGSKRKAARGLEENLEHLEECRNYWLAGLQEGGDRYKSGQEVAGRQERYAVEKPEEVTDERVEENYRKVHEMKPLMYLTGNEFQKGDVDLITQVGQFYESFGGKIHNDAIGDIYLTKDSVKDDIGHGIGRAKAITFAAVPEVLKHGYVLNYQRNWKRRGYDSAAIGAKVHIDGGRNQGDYYEVAIVKVMDDNRMYLHEVFTTKMEGMPPFKTPDFKRSDTRSGDQDLPSIYSIFEKLGSVKDEGHMLEDTDDIRFQLEDVDDYESHIVDLLHENDDLREANHYLKKQFELTSKEELRQKDIHKVTSDILKKYNSSYNQEILDRNVTKLFEYIRSAEQVDGKEVSAVGADIARVVLKQSKQVDSVLNEQYQNLRKEIRSTTVLISDQDKMDMEAAGGYNEFRKKYFGSIKMGKSGISVDAFYEMLAGQYPELFDLDITHPADRLLKIGNILDLTREQIRNPYHANMDEMSYIVGQELLESYFDVRTAEPTFADKKAVEIERARRMYKERIQKYKDKTVARYDALVAERDREIGRIKDSHKRELLVQQEIFNGRMMKRRDSLRSQNAKKRIMKEVRVMQTWLLSPTDSKHVPKNLRVSVADFLSHIDFSSKEDMNGVVTQRTQAWNDAKDAFRRIKDGVLTDDDGNIHYMEMDPDLMGRLEELTDKVKDVKRLEELDAYDLEELQKTVIAMKKAITEINDMKSNARYRKISLLAEDVFRDMEQVHDRPEYLSYANLADRLINYDMLDPLTVFWKIGPAYKTTYDALREGLNKKTLKLREAEDYFKESMENCGLTTKEIRKWTGTNAETHTFELNSGTITLSIPQMMSLYELNKRGQAKKHIYDRNGGIKADGRKRGMTFDKKGVRLPRIDKAARPIRISELDVMRIVSSLSPEQKNLADSMQKFMEKEIASWGNEVSMEMYGYEKFTAKNYFPILTDRNYIMQEEGEKGKPAIRNLGMTKGTNAHANNPVIIEDIFDVFTRQVDQMSSYNAYVLPLSDLNKVMNYKDMRGFNGSSIQEEMERTFGKNSKKYIIKLQDDMNGSYQQEGSFADRLLANVKTAAVAGNVRVAIQQPTAIVRASAEIDAKFLAKGLLSLDTKGKWDTICRYAPIAKWKDWGFYRMQTSRQMKDVLVNSDNVKQRFVNKTMIAAEWGDKIAWIRLWNACEAEFQAKHPDIKRGSGEFYQRVGARFSEIIDKTQVVDSTLHRTQIMRDTNGFMKLATSFMAEPLKSYNMLYRAAFDLFRKKEDAGERAARSAAAFVASGFFTAVAAAVIDAMRDNDRSRDWGDKYLEYVRKNAVDNLNILNSIPYVKDVLSIKQGYTPVRAEMSGVQDIVQTLKKLSSKGNGGYTAKYMLLNLAQSTSKVTGIPVKNITRDALALIDTAMSLWGGNADYQWMKQEYDIGNRVNRSKYTGLILEYAKQGNKRMADKIRVDMIAGGITEEEINASLNQQINDEMDIAWAAGQYDVSDRESRTVFEDEVEKYVRLKGYVGWSEAKSLKEIRDLLTKVYKPLWREAKTSRDKAEIVGKCKSFYYDGKCLYQDYNFQRNWK